MDKVGIDEFLVLAGLYPVFDVRSPAEYNHAHLPGAYNLPLFSDEERKVVGTMYKQQGRDKAIKAGLDYFGPKMRRMVEEVEAIIESKVHDANSKSSDVNHKSQIRDHKSILVHCWRGGMRSAGVAWLLDLYGFKVYTLVGGYKAFRNRILQQFEKPCRLNVVGGYTGSGKTIILGELKRMGHDILDLEAIAHHKGSAYGDLGEEEQPAPEMFENELALKLMELEGKEVWIEDESRRIGDLNLPVAFWNTLRASPVYFLDIPFEERLNYITAEYGKFKKEDLINATVRIRKRLGGLNTKNAISHLLEGDCKEAFRILLSYYDKYYGQSLNARNNLDDLLTIIKAAGTDARTNSKLIMEQKQIKDGIAHTGN